MKPWILSLDVVVVLGFVVAGKDSHNISDDVAGVLGTAAPFLIGLAVGWLVTRAWQRPAALTTGAGVLAATVAIGMVVRNLGFGDGTATSFILVATAFLGLGLMGWRVIAAALRRRRTMPAQAGR